MNEYENSFFMKCQENGEFDSFQDYIKNCEDFNKSYVVYIKQSDFTKKSSFSRSYLKRI